MKLSEIAAMMGFSAAEAAKRMPNQRGGVGISRQAFASIDEGSPRLSTIRAFGQAVGLPSWEVARLLEGGDDFFACVRSGGETKVAFTRERLRELLPWAGIEAPSEGGEG